ncbi:MAG: carbon storage regulator CsrA [Acidimicrobiia bacterium]
MLVLTRRVGQSILVGDDIVVTVLDNGRDQVRIGISAPHNVSVHREEVYAEIRLENRAASETAERDREPTVVAQVIDRLPTRSG